MRFKLFTVTKNEYDLIEDFILYYGNLFGFENLIVIDNGSDDEHVLQVYERYIPRGLTVVVEKGYEGDRQASHFTKHMNLHKSSCDWLIGLDTDEFLAYKDGDDYKCEDLVPRLEKFLSDLDQSYDKVCLNQLWSYCPITTIQATRPALEITEFFNSNTALCVRKRIFRASNFISVIVGNHDGKTVRNKEYVIPSNEFVYLHYHNTGFKRQIERARIICAAYGYININTDEKSIYEAICRLTATSGGHRIKQLRNFLQRKLILESFVKNLHYLPGEAEISKYWGCPIDQLDTRLLSDTPKSNQNFTLDEYNQLLYTNLDQAFIGDSRRTINSVASFLKSFDK